ncbi:unnamed protein product, partial [Closterium sp. NIES-53]
LKKLGTINVMTKRPFNRIPFATLSPSPALSPLLSPAPSLTHLLPLNPHLLLPPPSPTPISPCLQPSAAFLQSIAAYVPPTLPILCVSKGLELGSGHQGDDDSPCRTLNRINEHPSHPSLPLPLPLLPLFLSLSQRQSFPRSLLAAQRSLSAVHSSLCPADAAHPSIAQYVPPTLPILCVSKGLELGTMEMMTEVIPRGLGNPRQPVVILSGPTFAVEIIRELPTALVAASKDLALAKRAQKLLASKTLRVNTTTDVVGVEMAGALKNVLAIAAGIVEGMQLGNNCMAALVAQGCSEIRWLAEKVRGVDAWIPEGLFGYLE